MGKKIFLFLCGLFIVSCVSQNKVGTQLKDTLSVSNDQNIPFESPQDKLDYYYAQALQSRAGLPKNIDYESKAWKTYVGWMQAYHTLYQETVRNNQLLQKNGKIELTPGKSYSFDLESFCVNAGEHRAVNGDGFRPGPLKGQSKTWLPTLLKSYSKKGLKQEEAQTLIWALLAGAKFDELSIENKRNLLKIFPDAPVRFGNAKMESKITNLLRSKISSEISIYEDQFNRIRSIVSTAEMNYDELERIAAPTKVRSAIYVGWVKMPAGYFVRTISTNSYQGVRKEIYVPNTLGSNVFFDPTQTIEVPGEGQRIIASPVTRDPEMKNVSWECEQVIKRFPKKCNTMTVADRTKFIQAVDPKKFPKTRYKLPPNRDLPIEIEADCSTFVYEIYARMGFEYPMATTHAFSCVRTFREVSKEQAQMGDVVLYSGHMGILTNDNQVISATRGGSTQRSTDPERPDFISSIQSYPLSTFGAPRFFQWYCP